MTDIHNGIGDPLTFRHDALSLAFEAMYLRLLANGALRIDDLILMREAALAFPAMITASPSLQLRADGPKLTEAVHALFDRLNGSEWRPLSGADVWQSARVLVARCGSPTAAEYAWQRVRELTVQKDRPAVEVWCAILDAVEELGKTFPPDV